LGLLAALAVGALFFAWIRCYELLYVWTRSRNTLDEGFSTTENINDVRVKRLL
jgi:hypothetical protein